MNYSDSLVSTWDNAMEIEKLNQGAITEYPYRLGDKITIAETNAQYYPLDLEAKDDIVVWYTLGNAGSGDDIYDYSPRNARNNYYVYNKGNITFTGMGKLSVDKEEEIKLFINTMVAAYRVCVHAPKLNIVESPTDDTNKSLMQFQWTKF